MKTTTNQDAPASPPAVTQGSPQSDPALAAAEGDAKAWVLCCVEGFDPIYCETHEEIRAATTEAIFGGDTDGADHTREIDKSVEGLLRDGILRFEGDPPLYLLSVRRRPSHIASAPAPEVGK